MRKIELQLFELPQESVFFSKGITSIFLHLFGLGVLNNQRLGNNTTAKWKFVHQSKQSDGCVDWICKGLSRSFQDAVGFGIFFKTLCKIESSGQIIASCSA